MRRFCFATGTLVVILLLQTTILHATERRTLRNHIPEAVANGSVTPTGTLAASEQMHLVVSLPLRDPDGLRKLLSEISDPASPKYRQYLSPQQFTDMFGPTGEDYQAAINFAQASGLTIAGTSANRMIINVSGAVGDLERAFQTRIRTYHDPKGNREFYAPDIEPSVPAEVPIVEIIGLDNFQQRPSADWKVSPLAQPHNTGPGSAPDGCFIGSDFRAAYAPGVSLNGSGQTRQLRRFGPYWPSSVTNYETVAGLSNVQITNVLLDGMSPTANPGWDDGETSGDVENVIAMAPGAQVL